MTTTHLKLQQMDKEWEGCFSEFWKAAFLIALGSEHATGLGAVDCKVAAMVADQAVEELRSRLLG